MLIFSTTHPERCIKIPSLLGKVVVVYRQKRNTHRTLSSGFTGADYTSLTMPKLHGASLLSMIKFRTCNKFPVERGHWDNTEFANRKYELCPKNDIGDNFHYLLICPFFESQRKQYIDSYYFKMSLNTRSFLILRASQNYRN